MRHRVGGKILTLLVYGAMGLRVLDINADTFLNLGVSEAPILIFLMKTPEKLEVMNRGLTTGVENLVGGCVTQSAFSVYTVALTRRATAMSTRV